MYKSQNLLAEVSKFLISVTFSFKSLGYRKSTCIFNMLMVFSYLLSNLLLLLFEEEKKKKVWQVPLNEEG
jgi:hypothetical protein